MNTPDFRYFRALLVAGLGLPLAACGGGNSNSTPPPQVTIQLNQTSVSMLAGAQQQFTAVVQGTTNTAVTWSVDAVTGGNSSAGTITSSGMHTAPAQPGNHTVTATSVANTAKSASAVVTVQGLIAVSPPTVNLTTGGTQQFTVSVQGQSNPTVAWSVDGVTGGNSTVGTISTAGLYTAPSQIGNHTVGASITSPSASASSAITVFSLALSPGTTLLAPSGTQQFTATIQGLSNTGVTWSVDGTAGGNASVGTITSSGLYTAPATTGAHTISAASAAVPSVAATTSITVINTSAGAVLTYHNDDARDGAFTEETTLTPSVVNSTQFGKLRSYPVDGQIYAQPLFVPQLSIGGANHNVVFVATENDTVFAFDADGTPSTALWTKSL